MSRNLLTLKKGEYAPIDEQALKKWFQTKGFKPIHFENGKFETLTYWLGSPIYYKLKENHQGYTTFIKQAFGGSLLVFEIKLSETGLDCQSYCPILLFGFKRIELSFKEKSKWITKYRKEGYLILKQFEQFISGKTHRN